MESFLWDLIKQYNYRRASERPGIDVLEKEIEKIFRRMVLPLDVSVSLSFVGKKLGQINDPLFYEKSEDIVWKMLNEVAANDPHLQCNPGQRKLLRPLRDADSLEIYGYCGLNISYSSALKSIGGLEYKGSIISKDPAWGIAEYDCLVAQREPGGLAAPDKVIAAWAAEQVGLVQQGGFTERERQQAADSLGAITGDLRPLFIAQTNEGWLDLDAAVKLVTTRNVTTIPIESYSSEAQITSGYTRTPVCNGLYLGFHDVKFDGFVLSFDGSQHISSDVEEGQYNFFWAALVNSLRSANIAHELVFKRASKIGNYIGVGSEHHGIVTGDPIYSDVCQIVVK